MQSKHQEIRVVAVWVCLDSVNKHGERGKAIRAPLLLNTSHVRVSLPTLEASEEGYPSCSRCGHGLYNYRGLGPIACLCHKVCCQIPNRGAMQNYTDNTAGGLRL